MAVSPYVDALTVHRTINAAPAQVFNAWKDPNLLRQWLGGQSYQKLHAEVDFRVGGGYRIDILSPTGDRLQLHGEYQEIDEPQRLVFTWAFDHWDSAEDTTLVTVQLAELDGQTAMTLTHERFRDVPTRDLHHEGWLMRLDAMEQFI